MTKSEKWNIRKVNEALLKWITSMRGNNIPINGLFFWRKLMNLLKSSITTILQYQSDG